MFKSVERPYEADMKTTSERVKSVWEECKEGHAEEIYNADETVPTTT
jgi:hypothetical protein